MASLFIKRLLVILFSIFCIAYPIAAAGLAFNVHPPFSLDWAGSVLLFLEGTLLIVAAMVGYGWLRGLFAGLLILLLSYGAEAVGVGTSFPFGAYRYTRILFPILPGSVPAAVMFAWVLIVLGAYGCVSVLALPSQQIGFRGALLGAFLATLLDLEIEPVAFHLERYWQWLAPGRVSYYGVPLANFAAWFVLAWMLLLCVDAILRRGYSSKFGSGVPKLAFVVPRMLFYTSLFMFALVDLTHGYFLAILPGVLAVAIISVRRAYERSAPKIMQAE